MEIGNKDSKETYIVLEYFIYKDLHGSSIYKHYKCLDKSTLKEKHLYNNIKGDHYYSSSSSFNADLATVKKSKSMFELIEHVIINEESIILI